MASNLPSSFSRNAPSTSSSGGAVPPHIASPSGSSQMQPSSESKLPLILSVIALLLGLASVYGTFFMDHPLSPSQKTALLEIADNLKSLQNRDITLSAPISTTVVVDKTYLLKDLFPANFEIPIDFEIPINTNLVGISTTGQPVTFQVEDKIPIKARLPINDAAFGSNTVRLYKEIPMEARFSSSIKVRAAYGQELNSIIDKLGKIAGEQSG